mgnify:CR=1 FL=1
MRMRSIVVLNVMEAVNCISVTPSVVSAFADVSPFLLVSFPFLYHFIILKNSDWMFLQCYLNVVDGVLGGVDRHCPGVDLLNFVAFVAMRLDHLLHFVK